MRLNTGDKGQRYEVMCCTDDKNIEKPFGWSNSIEGATMMEKSINRHPCWHSPRIIDREATGCLIQIGEGPACFQLIKSGWTEKGWYHLIYEDPEEGSFSYKHRFVTESQIRNRFPYAIKRMEELKK